MRLVMARAAFIIKRFPSDHYTAVFNPYSGFFARLEDPDRPEPFWSEHGPELMDIAITNWCNRECPFCYRRSSQTGTHIRLGDYVRIIEEARSMHVFQVALGGGNPNQHPHFTDILRITRETFGIVPNYTTNGRGLTSTVLEATREFCGVVAISAYPPYEETIAAVDALRAHGVTTNIHFVLTSQTVNTAIEWLLHPPTFLQYANAIVFLNYKPVGRQVEHSLLLNRSARAAEFFDLATAKRQDFRVGFDSCSITGLARLGRVPTVSLEGCDAGRFSLFISEKMQVYPCSFMLDAGYQGASLAGSSILEIWQHHPVFRRIRAKHAERTCGDCTTHTQCLSGCPVFPEINLCPKHQTACKA